MSAPLLIRDARLTDAEALAPLLDTLGYPAPPATVRQRLTALLHDDPTARVLVALRGEAIVGLATLHATPVLHRPTPVARVTALVVSPSAQGGGVGRALMAAAERHFNDAGYRRVEVTSGPTHTAAHEFYRHLGYRDQGVRFARELG
ncbi:MAG TPA: GNAT family N-acetyltransferase [Gemmatimonadales bacterium]|nr:GNAT family N-acetyltransferase [Gemmatimonadales bacterium]